jgi:hypothetical protein
MPHKKNPVTCERIAGLSRLLRGYALAAMENVCLWHERDIAHSSVARVALPDASLVLDYMLQTMTWVIEGLTVHTDRMLENLQKTRGVVFSGQVLLALMEQGLSRTKAYERVQRAALDALRLYDWPGNVRELERLVERAVALVEADRIELDDLPPQVRGEYGEVIGPSIAAGDSMRAWGSRYVRLMFERCGRNKRRTCRALDISYHTLSAYLCYAERGRRQFPRRIPAWARSAHSAPA